MECQLSELENQFVAMRDCKPLLPDPDAEPPQASASSSTAPPVVTDPALTLDIDEGEGDVDMAPDEQKDAMSEAEPCIKWDFEAAVRHAKSGGAIPFHEHPVKQSPSLLLHTILFNHWASQFLGNHPVLL